MSPADRGRNPPDAGRRRESWVGRSTRSTAGASRPHRTQGGMLACRYADVDMTPDGGGDHDRRTFPAEGTEDLSLADEEAAERALRDRGTRQLSPLVLAHV